MNESTATLVSTLVSEVVQLIVGAVSASKEKAAEIEQRLSDAIAALRGTREQVHADHDARTADTEATIATALTSHE